VIQPAPVVVHVEIYALQRASVVNEAGSLSQVLASTQALFAESQ
jgi:hypothetical protein